jgi:hypothetical protein
MLKRVLFAVGISAIALAGTAQLASEVCAANRCDRILCIPCPDGYVLSPKGGNCCRCVPAP